MTGMNLNVNIFFLQFFRKILNINIKNYYNYARYADF